MTRYQLVYAMPNYDDRDCITGWRFFRCLYAYGSEALPRKFAQQYNETCDPAYATVVPYGGDVHRAYVSPPKGWMQESNEECPF